jgi:hypothetical protein
MVAPLGVNYVGFAGKQALIVVEGDQKSVRPVGDVFDQIAGQIQQHAIISYRRVEIATDLEKTAGEDQVPDAAIIE